MTDVLARYQLLALGTTDAPPIYHQFGALMCLSATMGKLIHMPWSNSTIYPNLYCILIGESTAFRKTTAMRLARNIIWKQDRGETVLPDDFSYEGLFDNMAKHPVSIAFFEEFESLMGKIGRENMSQLKGFLTSVYDCPPEIKKSLRGVKRKGATQEENTQTVDTIIHGPCLSVFTGTTVEWLVHRMTEDDFRSGFMARWMMVPATWSDLGKEMVFPASPSQDEIQDYIAELNMCRQTHGEMSFCDKALWERHHVEFSEKYTPRGEGKQRDKVFEPYFERLKIYAIKIAMLTQASKCAGTLVIDEQSIADGWSYANWLAEAVLGLKPRLAFTPHHRMCLKIEELLRGGDKTRSQLLRALPRNANARDLDVVIQSLIEDGTVFEDRVRAVDGACKPTILYRYANSMSEQEVGVNSQ